MWNILLAGLVFWLTPRQVYQKSREDPEKGFVMGWPKTWNTYASYLNNQFTMRKIRDPRSVHQVLYEYIFKKFKFTI